MDQESIKQTEIQKEWKHSTSLSNGLFQSATERFFYIESIMKQYSLTNTFHLETDNLIFFDIKKELYKFEENYNIAGTFDCGYRMIPGFMFFKNDQHINAYNQFIHTATHEERKSTNDMQSWGSFRKKRPDIVKNLPRIPKRYPLEKNKEDYIQHIDLFEAIFDANEIGQYLGGLSPRNNYGKLGFINETCVHKIDNKFSFTYERDSEKRRILYLYYNCRNCNWDDKPNKEKYRVNNLHVHSKNLINFMSI